MSSKVRFTAVLSIKIRFVAVLSIASVMTCGSLGAFTLGQRALPGARPTPVLTELMDWVASFLPSGRLQGKSPKAPHSKIAAQMDPDGHH
jgi:hypothetical protein